MGQLKNIVQRQVSINVKSMKLMAFIRTMKTFEITGGGGDVLNFKLIELLAGLRVRRRNNR